MVNLLVINLFTITVLINVQMAHCHFSCQVLSGTQSLEPEDPAPGTAELPSSRSDAYGVFGGEFVTSKSGRTLDRDRYAVLASVRDRDTFIHPSIHTSIYLSVCVSILPSLYLSRSFHLLIHSFILSSIYAFAHSFHLPIHSIHP